VLLGGSTDTAYVHLAWRDNHPDLKELKFPMVSDHAKTLTTKLGILTGADQVALRATFIVDPENTIRWVSVNDLSVGRNIDETIRVLDALQTGELTPCNWHKGEATL
jgi:lipoyl-dependent peroxiredoxin subunit C